MHDGLLERKGKSPAGEEGNGQQEGLGRQVLYTTYYLTGLTNVPGMPGLPFAHLFAIFSLSATAAG